MGGQGTSTGGQGTSTGGQGTSTGGDGTSTGGQGTSSGAATGSGGVQTGSGGGGPSPSDGCAQPSQQTEGQKSIDVGGTTRTYYLLPSNTDDPVPLFITFHGHSGTGQGAVNTFELPNRSGGRAVIMSPDGVAQAWYGNAVGWDNRSNTSPDVAFTEALIEEAGKLHCIDRSRVYLAGFSWGGWMVTQAACALGDKVRAIVSGAGGPPEGTCVGPVSALIAHGTADTAEPLVSGTQSRDKFVALNQCGSGTSPAGMGTCVAYQGCVKPTWWWQHDLGHTVPSGFDTVAWDFMMSAP